MPFILLALGIAAAIGGGTSLAAQNALPNEALWVFKVSVNETMQAALAAEGKAQADFDIAAIETRLTEARELAAQTKLTTQTQDRIKANFEIHAKSVAAQITALTNAGDFAVAADIAARFQATLAKEAEGALDIRTALDEASRLSADTNEKAKQ